MKWISIKKNEVSAWNEKLKTSTASFFQYPYYAAGYRHFLFSKPVFLQLTDAEKVIGYCCLMQISFLFLKIGLVMRGPVFFYDNNDIKNSIEALKTYAKKNDYIFLRINPNEEYVEDILQTDSMFETNDYFNVYKGSQHKDLVIYKRLEAELLQSFRDDCRSKIRFQQEMNYSYKKVQTEAELKDVYNLFKELGDSKSFNYRPFKSYAAIFLEGKKHDLCDVYTARLKEKLVCAAYIIKDGNGYTYFSGALMLNEIKPKYSPANNLHYLIMKDCFYNDGKEKYNLSYSPPGSGVYMFKTSFRPVEVDKPSIYTFVINHRLSGFILRLQSNDLKKAKNRLRRLLYFFKK